MKLRNLFLLLCITGAGGMLRAADSTQSQKPVRPNIVIVMADDLDSRQLSCYGGENLQTVHIDRLADEGLKFNQVIASEAMCIPIRTSLFTGLYPVHHGSYQNHKPVYDSVRIKSVAHYLGDLGYTVALTGKNHVTKPVSVFPFRIVNGFEPNCVSPTDEYSVEGIREFMTQEQKPFCLFVMSINPHAPWTSGDASEFDAAKLKLPPHWVDTRDTREQFTRYLAEVRRLDNQVGDVMELLRQTGRDRNTIVIFLGEQGPQFPGGKWTLWDNGQKSSMIVRWPGVVKSGQATEALVQYEDITPTLIEIAGGRAVSGLDGKSFVSVLRSGSQTFRDYAYGIHNNIPAGTRYPVRAVRSTRYKLILNLEPERAFFVKAMMNRKKVGYWNSWMVEAEGSASARKLTDRIVHRPAVEFYDIRKDPYELHNLAGDPAYKDLVAQYTGKLRQWMQEQGDRGADMDVDNE